MLSCSAALAHIILRERLHIFGILGCVLCVVGSTTIVLHAPQEREIESVREVWDLAMEPGSHVSTLKYYSLVKISYWTTNQVTQSFFCSISLLCSFGYDSYLYSYLPLHSSIWPDTHNGLYWCLFPCRFPIGMSHHLVVDDFLIVLAFLQLSVFFCIYTHSFDRLWVLRLLELP